MWRQSGGSLHDKSTVSDHSVIRAIYRHTQRPAKQRGLKSKYVLSSKSSAPTDKPDDRGGHDSGLLQACRMKSSATQPMTPGLTAVNLLDASFMSGVTGFFPAPKGDHA
jgi:hypothetical protein